MITGIASLLAVQESAVHSQIATAVVGKQLDVAEQQGAAVNALLTGAAKLSKSLSTGQNFDAVA